eukprot:1139394-Pelagomonas_calceolata.AAC.1
MVGVCYANVKSFMDLSGWLEFATRPSSTKGLTSWDLRVLTQETRFMINTVKDGEKTACVHPNTGVKQGCPLSPLIFSLYVKDIDDLAGGVRGAVTGTDGKGETLAQKSHKFPPPRSFQIEHANGDLEGYWKHPVPEPDCEE